MKEPIPVGLVLITATMAFPLTATAAAQEPPVVLEKTGDAYLPPRSLGTTPRAVVTFGPYTSYQANVDGAGNNIVGDAANEPSIAVDPTNPSSMVIGWRQFDTTASNFRQAGWAYTQDAGQSWTFPGVLEPGVFRSDPVVDVDSQGNFYYLSLVVVPNFNTDVWISSDGGVSWSGPFFSFGGDKSWFTVDKTSGAGAGNLYQSWNVAGNIYFPDIFNRSANGGTGWSNPILVPDWPVFGTLDVSSGGDLYISGTPLQAFDRISLSKSTNAKFGGANPSFTTQDVQLGGNVSLFGGPNPDGLHGQIWVAVDRSGGATNDNVYVLASLDPPGPDPMNVQFIRSTDGGSTWSSPIRVNDDPAGTNAWQWFGTMSISPAGRIDVVWNDTRASGQENICELYYAYSVDGGSLWSDNVQVSPSFDSHLGWPNQNKLGDYYDMVSDDEGANLAYAATFNGEQDVYFVKVFPDCNGNGTPDHTDIQNGTSSDENGNGLPDECELVLAQDPLVRGQQSTLVGDGFLAPGETVFYGYSTTGTGAGPCIFGGNLCIDLLSPVLIGTAVVGANGSASLATTIPPNAPLIQVYTQAAIDRGTVSIKSNVVVDTIQ